MPGPFAIRLWLNFFQSTSGTDGRATGSTGSRGAARRFRGGRGVESGEGDGGGGGDGGDIQARNGQPITTTGSDRPGFRDAGVCVRDSIAKRDGGGVDGPGEMRQRG